MIELNILSNSTTLISIFSKEETDVILKYFSMEELFKNDNFVKKFSIENFSGFSKVNFIFSNPDNHQFFTLVSNILAESKSGYYFLNLDRQISDYDSNPYFSFLENLFHLKSDVKIFLCKRNNDGFAFSRNSVEKNSYFINKIVNHNKKNNNIFIIQPNPTNIDTNIIFSLKHAITDHFIVYTEPGLEALLYLKHIYEIIDNFNGQKYRLGFFQSNKLSRFEIISNFIEKYNIKFNDNFLLTVQPLIFPNKKIDNFINSSFDINKNKKVYDILSKNEEPDIFLNNKNFLVFYFLKHFSYQLIKTKIDLVYETNSLYEYNKFKKPDTKVTITEKIYKYLAIGKPFIPTDFGFYQILLSNGFKTSIKLFENYEQLNPDNYRENLAKLVEKIINCSDEDFNKMIKNIEEDIKYDTELFYKIFYQHSLLDEIKIFINQIV